MRIVCLLCLTCLFYTSSLAQVEQDTTRASYLNEITISANRWEQNLRDVSNHVAKVGKPLVELQNPQTSADLLGLSNQVFIQKSQLGGGSPMIRGFATNRILLVVDGVRMNNAIFRSGNLQNVISLDANAIEETEVIFGPGSVMYGSDAIGGVMDFHTLKPRLSFTGKPTINGSSLVRYASANSERTGHIDFNIGTKKWGFTTSITKSIYGDLKMGSKGSEDYTRPDYQVRDENGNDIAVVNPNPDNQLFTGFDQFNMMQKIRFKPNDNWDLSYGFHFSETSDVPRYDRLILKSNGAFVSAEWYYGPQQWSMHTLAVTNLNSTKISDQVKLTVGYQNYKESRHNRNFSGSNRNRRTDRYENVEALSINLDLDKQFNDRTDLFYGLEYVTNSIGSTAERVDITDGTISAISTRYPDGSEWRSSSAYLSLRYRLNQKWLINASTRYTHVYTYAPYDLTYFNFPFTEATLNNGALNGSVGVVYNPNRNWKVYSNFSTGFRAPNVDDIGKVFDSQPGAVIVPNPQLEPETAYNAEVGFTGTISGALTLDVSAFYTLLDNAIVRGPYTFDGESQIDYDGTLSSVLALQNSSELFVRGFQIGLVYDFAKYLKLISNINIQDGRETDIVSGEDFSPTHVAPLFGSTQIVFSHNKLQVSLYSNYQGIISYKDLALSERADSHLYANDQDGNPYAPSWITFNLKTTYSISKYLLLNVGIENVLNERYRPYSSGISAAGRNIVAAIRVKF